jgi:hypothetical protein
MGYYFAAHYIATSSTANISAWPDGCAAIWGGLPYPQSAMNALNPTQHHRFMRM